MDTFIVTLSSMLKILPMVREAAVSSVKLEEPFLDLAARFAQEPGTVLLMSGGHPDCARHHLLAVRPWLSMETWEGQTVLTIENRSFSIDGNPFDILQAVMRHFAIPAPVPGVPVAAGLFGYFAYDLKDHLETLPRTAVDDLGLPQLRLFAPSVIFIQDIATGQTLRCLPIRDPGPPGDSAANRDDHLPPFPKPVGFSVNAAHLRSSFTKPAYLEAVRAIKAYILSGDSYQVNLSQRFETAFSGRPFDLFKTLYIAAPGPFYAYLNLGDHHIVSTSPERFLHRSGSRVETRPIKGTRPRGATPEQDRAFAQELLASPKDDAELSMIVDLMRNDLGRVCRGGSVRVAEHKRLETYPNVFHLVSVVEGMLGPGKDSVDLLKATFPGGSITGCPRIRAMEIIDELEPVRRHVYTGSIGYLGFHDTLDLSIAIRTAVIHRNRMVFSVGGGVVHDSDPAAEYEETLHKAKTLMGVLATDDGGAGPDPWVWLNGRLAPQTQARLPLSALGVQYGFGFFETLRVDKGRPGFLKDHVKRFNDAWKALFGGAPPDITWDAVIRRILTRNNLLEKTAAVKLMAFHGEPGDSPFRHHLAATARPWSPRPSLAIHHGLRLATYPHPRQTPLADHKTLNYLYYYLAGQWAAQQGADEALILNPDGSVSETNTANLLMICGNTIVRPLSPHALPGIMEKQVLGGLQKQGYALCTRNVFPEELLTADGVLLTNSLMGPAPAVSLDGKALGVEELRDRLIPSITTDE